MRHAMEPRERVIGKKKRPICEMSISEYQFDSVFERSNHRFYLFIDIIKNTEMKNILYSFIDLEKILLYSS